jgi:hypothetical protein
MGRMRNSAVVATLLAAIMVVASPTVSYAAARGSGTVASTNGASDNQAVAAPGSENGAFLSLQATAGCRATCDFQDPATFKIYYSGCSTCYRFCATDGSTIYTAKSDNGSVLVELRYSPWCRTVWSRTYQNYYPTIKSFYLSGAQRTAAGGFVSGPWSQMLDDADLLGQACGAYGPATACTSKY